MGWGPKSKPSSSDALSATGVTWQESLFSSTSSLNPAYDISILKAYQDWFAANKPTLITQGQMDNTNFADCHNGSFHSSLLAVSESSDCQFCRFRYQNVCSVVERQNNKWMFNPSTSIERCFVCNVNLCWL